VADAAGTAPLAEGGADGGAKSEGAGAGAIGGVGAAWQAKSNVPMPPITA
jgi:hypothetical protein